MYIFGDIGNTETKICLVSLNNKILKKHLSAYRFLDPSGRHYCQFSVVRETGSSRTLGAI